MIEFKGAGYYIYMSGSSELVMHLKEDQAWTIYASKGGNGVTRTLDGSIITSNLLRLAYDEEIYWLQELANGTFYGDYYVYKADLCYILGKCVGREWKLYDWVLDVKHLLDPNIKVYSKDGVRKISELW